MTSPPNPLVMIVEDDPASRRMVEVWLGRQGYRTASFSDGLSAVEAASELAPDAVLLDRQMPGISGHETLLRLRRAHPTLPVVMMTADTTVQAVVDAMQAGAYDYVPKPLDRTKLLTTLRNAVDSHVMSTRLAELERQVEGNTYPEIIAKSQAMKSLFRQIDRVARSDITVLIQGESGTGKELVARAIHRHGARADGPFVPINCAAIPESLQEAELFGAERGAFTGANARRQGLFEAANGGTLFLDEVAELAPGTQAKLLRVLQEKRFYRVGGTTEVPVDVRILAASHRDLDGLVAQGAFRSDLYYRLAVCELELPPLREREHDITLLARHFALQLGERHGRGPIHLRDDAIHKLERYSWPGNVRELHNAIERAVVLSSGQELSSHDLPSRILSRTTATPVPPPALVFPHAGIASRAKRAAEEREAIVAALEATDGNVSEVVRVLDIPRTTLYRKLKKYGLR